MTPQHRAEAGFTLIELMVTLSIAAVLMIVAVPSYQTYARNAAVAQISGNFFNATQLARANAMRLSSHTLVQVVDADRGWVGGWRVYADIDRDMV
ncbi:Tfp pilus assembly protein FimT/FimU, partial [Hydrogenophaga sp.]